MKTYQAFAKTSERSKFVLTEIKVKNIKEAREWFKKNTFEHEEVESKTKTSFNEIMNAIAKAENAEFTQNGDTYSFYKNQSWIGATNEKTGENQGVIKNYFIDFSDENGWSALPLD